MAEKLYYERVVKPAIVDVLWERQYYNGVNKENRFAVGLNPKIGEGIEREADRIIEALRKVNALV